MDHLPEKKPYCEMCGKKSRLAIGLNPDRELQTLCGVCREGAMLLLSDPRLILVVVEGGCIQCITERSGETWDVWDWDDFKDDPESYWDERGEEVQEHIKREWPSMYVDIMADINIAKEAREEERHKDPFCDVPDTGGAQ